MGRVQSCLNRVESWRRSLVPVCTNIYVSQHLRLRGKRLAICDSIVPSFGISAAHWRGVYTGTYVHLRTYCSTVQWTACTPVQVPVKNRFCALLFNHVDWPVSCHRLFCFACFALYSSTVGSCLADCRSSCILVEQICICHISTDSNVVFGRL